MNEYLAKLKNLKTRHPPTDKTDKNQKVINDQGRTDQKVIFVSFVSTTPPRFQKSHAPLECIPSLFSDWDFIEHQVRILNRRIPWQERTRNRRALLAQYNARYWDAFNAEAKGHCKENAGRHAANSWLLELAQPSAPVTPVTPVTSRKMSKADPVKRQVLTFSVAGSPKKITAIDSVAESQAEALARLQQAWGNKLLCVWSADGVIWKRN